MKANTSILLAASLAATLVLTGCSNPADDVAEAQVSEETVVEATATDAAGTFFAIDPGSSSIGFIGSKVTGSHEGGFTNFVGEVRVVDGKVADTGSKVVIEMESTFSDSGRLTGHLKDEDFFYVSSFPTSTFETTKVETKDDGTATVTGNLTLRGVTKSISFPATITVTEEALALQAEFHINRLDFDIKYSGRADDLVREEVVLKFDIKATPGRAEFSA